MITEGNIGPSNLNGADGVHAELRLGRTGEAVVSELNGRYYEQSYRGQVFNAFSGAVTIAATNVSPLAAGTGTPVIGLYNPIGSGKNLSILKLYMATISGTPGGPLVWNYAVNQNITATPNGTAYPSMLGGGGASVSKVFLNTATTGSTAGVPFRVCYGATAVAAGSALGPILQDVGGDIIVPPGGYLGLAAYAAGTSHIVLGSLVWAENYL